ncbi:MULTISPECIES: hypothetical protein [Amycolatopsis]|uniref:PknH-like extracellular domain-containing protein n=1 Tax=Amycolatopsis dongchuanensis TaxID=1070866 RepID=A0ABP8VM20_9PSEU
MRKLWLFLVAAGLLAACSSSPAPVAAPPPLSPAPEVSDQQRLVAALPSEDEAERYGLEPTGTAAPLLPSETTRVSLGKPCDRTLPSDVRIAGAAQAIWYLTDNNPRLQVRQVLARYSRTAGATVVQEVEQSLTCRTGTDEDEVPYAFDGKLALPPISGADRQVAYCVHSTGLNYRDCYVYAARGEFAMMLDFRTYGDKDSANHVVPTLTAQLATALTRT